MKIHIQPKLARVFFLLMVIRAILVLAMPAQADPRTNCWLTTYAGQCARVYTNSTMQSSGTSLTTWANSSMSQSLPAYCGVQEVYSSTNWVYVRSTGLASYTMGPWFLDAAKTTLFPNLPTNQQVLYRFPCTNGIPTTKTENGGGQIGIFVDGVAMYNSWDAYTWDTTNQSNVQNITGYWNRDAYVNEGVSFDPGNAHQQNSGVYHYHADPLGLRYQLGDHIDFNASTKIFSEDTNTPTKHSPILGWAADGFPIYGPYGYSNPTNVNSGIRRMVSGYVLRNGQDGTTNLGLGRTTIPQWAMRLYDVSANQSGPTTNQDALGTYMEDNDYLDDDINPNTGTNYQQGADFDLDQYNGRWCYTPDFTNEIYAYFVAISSNGAPVFPYDIGRGFYGSPVGGSVSAIAETVATNFLGYTNLVSSLNPPAIKNTMVTLTWSALEGGTYKVQSTTNLTGSPWTTLSSSVMPNEITGSYTNVTAVSQNFYRVARTAVASYQGAGTTTIATETSVAPGGNANPGQNIFLTITLPTTPPDPPLNAPTVPTVVLSNTTTTVTISGQDITRTATNIVTAIIPIPAGLPQATNNVIVSFNGMPTYTLTGGFIIN